MQLTYFFISFCSSERVCIVCTYVCSTMGLDLWRVVRGEERVGVGSGFLVISAGD